MLSSITALVADHRSRLEAQAANAETTINDFRRMASEAIGVLDERHRQDTKTVAVMFDNLVNRELNRLNEFRAELAIGQQEPEVLPALPNKRKNRHDQAPV